MFAMLVVPGRVLAQSGGQEPAPQAPPTRAEFLRQQRDAKAKVLKPYEPNGLERGMAIGERVGQLLQRDGIYLKMGSLTTGSGFAYGAGYRDRSLFREPRLLRCLGWRFAQEILGGKCPNRISAQPERYRHPRGLCQPL